MRYYKDHFGHTDTDSIGTVRLPKSQQLEFAGNALTKSSFPTILILINFTDKMAEGHSKRSILSNIVPQGQDDPLVFVTMKSLWNIARTFRVLTHGQYNVDDRISTITSLELFEWRYRNLAEEVCVVAENMVDCVDNAFVVLMNPYQCRALRRFANSNTGVIGIDSTHEMTSHGHYLTTVVVQSERREGIPVAFCISRHRSTATWKRFFSAIRQVAGPISCSSFISDGDSSYYNAWKEVMGPVLRRRLCIWHVKKSWGERMVQLKFTTEELQETKSKLTALVDQLNPVL